MKLEIDGYRIYWQHTPPSRKTIKISRQYATELGFTVCYIDKEGHMEAQAKAICSEKDLFNKEKGRKVSLARALQQLKHKLTKEQRAEVWDMFRKLTKQPKWGRKNYVHVSELSAETESING